MNYPDNSYLGRYLKAVNPFIGGGANSLNTSVIELGGKIGSSSKSETSVQGLLFGNVQSGKTSHIFGIISYLADQGDRLFIVLTSDNVQLQKQTLERALSTLEAV